MRFTRHHHPAAAPPPSTRFYRLLLLLLAAASCGGGGGGAGTDGPTAPPDTTTPPDPAAVATDSVIFFDEHHVNYHTLGTTYMGFGGLLRSEGFEVVPSRQELTAAHLDSAGVLVTVNALHPSNETVWTLPTPSAFSADEVAVVHQWVEDGGALLVIADHMPFPGAAAMLAGAFDVAVSNGFAFDTTVVPLPSTCLDSAEIHIFRRSDGTLAPHPITDGRDASERIDSVATFTGSAFDPIGVLDPLMVFTEDAISIEPATAWDFGLDTTVVPVGGWLQGGAARVGQGRIAMLGEAAMFTQRTCEGRWDRRPIGWGAPGAEQNQQFLINLIRWLTGEL